MLVFVYGTLMKGNRLHGHLKECGEPVRYRLNGFTLHSTDYGFPYMVPCQGAHVNGEVYDVSDEKLSWLDKIEREGELYNRVIVDTFDGVPVHAYVANQIQVPGYSDWKDQPGPETIKEWVIEAVEIMLEDDGIDLSAWEILNDAIDLSDISDLEERNGRMYFA